MSPKELFAALGEGIAKISGGEFASDVLLEKQPWSAAQWRDFSRFSNQLISEQWAAAPCAHQAGRYTYTSMDREYCELCMRAVGP
jgi:hypothetical protein